MSTTSLPTVGEYVTVTRSLRRPFRSPLVFVPRHPGVVFDGGALRFEAPFVLRADWPAPSFRAPARLRLSRWRSRAVVVEIHPASTSRSELRLRPVSLRVARWGRRRQHRYFAAAHRAADELARSLHARSTVPSHRPRRAGAVIDSPPTFRPAA